VIFHENSPGFFKVGGSSRGTQAFILAQSWWEDSTSQQD
jgi:hypothetical protein